MRDGGKDMEEKLEQQIRASMNIHRPMEADAKRSVETRCLSKKVVQSKRLWDGAELAVWHFDGEGEARAENGVLVLETEARAEHWPAEEVRAVDAQAGQYATFGSYIARLPVKGGHTARYNRIRFSVRPRCSGLHSPILRVGFVNDGAVKIPDAYSREGFHAVNLKNGEWNDCVWEIDSIAHDSVTELSFNVHRYGREVSGGTLLCFELKDIRLEQVEKPDVVHGWQCAPDTAVFSTTGYWPEGTKTAVANTECERFEVLDAENGAVVFEGAAQPVQNARGAFRVLDFTPLEAEGVYQLHFGGYTSEPFRIAQDVPRSTVWKLLNFLFCERCGYPVPGKHGTCHGDVTAEHEGVRMAYQGGWHDAADVSQQTVQTAEVAHALMEAARAVKETDGALYGRLLEEVNWGVDFVLRTRLGDGWRATSAGIRRWTDGLVGNMDDCAARVQNRAFDNFIMAGVEASASRLLAGSDAPLAWKCLDAAQEDFDFAVQRFEEHGLDKPVMDEHTANASLSQYYAAACWAAAQLHLAGSTAFGVKLRICKYGCALLACQDTGEAKLPFSGFFYRDETKRVPVHFSHQSREHLFMQALCAACEALPRVPEKTRWEKAMRRYGDYLKAMAAYTAPYGMLPAGVFSETELDDAETFALLHPTVKFEAERENYRAQLQSAEPLGGGWYVRCFPVWFSFRGNSAVHLSMGKAASLLGRALGDDALLDIAREQLYWTLGKNPFGQSLIYGEGDNYGQQYAALLGETVGEIPVGVQTRANEDVPYWPQANIATYREVWTTPAGRWLWIVADLMGHE